LMSGIPPITATGIFPPDVDRGLLKS